MILVLDILLGSAATLVLGLCGLLFVEVLAACGRRESLAQQPGEGRPVAVLVPAHNEAFQIGQTLGAIRSQLTPSDRLLVVADNCSDATAAVAREAGAEVIVRQDPERRGKGYALDFGVRHLERAPPEVVIVVDADCQVAAGTLQRLANLCTATGRPVQSLYLMKAPDGGGFAGRFAEFAWVMKNQVRPLGLHRLGLPCQLMGTGMAFPWSQIQRSRLASGNLVEDMKLGMDLARAGSPPLFSPDTLVSSVFPASDAGARGQRTRWEHGHLLTILRDAPRAIARGVATLNVPLIAIGIDLSIPPLALLALFAAVIGGLAVVLAVLTRTYAPTVLAAVSMGLLGASVLIAWWRFARHIVSARELALAPFYVVRKFPLYAGFLVSRQMEWVRSKRDGES